MEIKNATLLVWFRGETKVIVAARLAKPLLDEGRTRVGADDVDDVLFHLLDFLAVCVRQCHRLCLSQGGIFQQSSASFYAIAFKDKDVVFQLPLMSTFNLI